MKEISLMQYKQTVTYKKVAHNQLKIVLGKQCFMLSDCCPLVTCKVDQWDNKVDNCNAFGLVYSM